MKRALYSFGLAAVLFSVLALMVVTSQPVQAQNPTVGTIYGPFYQDLWTATPISSTAVTQSLTVLGAPVIHIGYDLGLASNNGAFTVTAVKQWHGASFFTTTGSVLMSTTLPFQGVLTVTSASPYLPVLYISVQTSGGTVTPTISIWGQ